MSLLMLAHGHLPCLGFFESTDKKVCASSVFQEVIQGNRSEKNESMKEGKKTATARVHSHCSAAGT